MKCFNHPGDDALGSCKHCNKGLCHSCVVDLGSGLACRGHERQVELTNMVIEKNIKAYSAASRNMWIMPVFFLFMGLVFAVHGYSKGGRLTDFGMLLGIGFIVLGVVQAVASRRLFARSKES